MTEIPRPNDPSDGDALLHELREGYRQNPIVTELDRTTIFAAIRAAAASHQTEVCIGNVPFNDVVFHPRYPHDVRYASLRVGSKIWTVSRWLKQLEGIDVSLRGPPRPSVTAASQIMSLLRPAYSTQSHASEPDQRYRLFVSWERLLALRNDIILESLPPCQSIDGV